MNQATLRDVLRIDGVGVHTGSHAHVDVHPAPFGSGIVFLLQPPDGSGDAVRVPASAEYIVDTSLATVIGRDGATVSTIEHLLSALLGMGISDAEIHVTGPEIPIVDGSAKHFVEQIASTGLNVDTSPRPEFVIEQPFELREGDRAVIVLPSNEFRVRFVADYEPPIGTHYYNRAIEPQGYRDEIAAARTFAYLRDVEAMRARGLALGGSLDNALVFDTDGPMQPLRWPNETVRHKVLDLIGDFALLGAWPRCEIIGIKSGHGLHAKATRALRERARVASTAGTA